MIAYTAVSLVHAIKQPVALEIGLSPSGCTTQRGAVRRLLKQGGLFGA